MWLKKGLLSTNDRSASVSCASPLPYRTGSGLAISSGQSGSQWQQYGGVDEELLDDDELDDDRLDDELLEAELLDDDEELEDEETLDDELLDGELLDEGEGELDELLEEGLEEELDEGLPDEDELDELELDAMSNSPASQ